jgi:hypothetical protein
MSARLALSIRLRRGHELFGNAKAPNDKLVNFQSPDLRSTDCQFTNGHRTDGDRANCGGAQRKRTKRSRSDAKGWKCSRAHSLAFGR